jgi:mannose-6-phosphate isomerase-like protein (cupin superfamily)
MPYSSYVRAADAPAFTLPGVEFRGLTAPSRGARELCTWHLYVAPGPAGEPHSLDHEEVFVVIEGQLMIRIDGVESTLLSGDAIAVPAGTQLQVANISDETAHALVCIAAGFQATMVNGQHIGTPPWAQ